MRYGIYLKEKGRLNVDIEENGVCVGPSSPLIKNQNADPQCNY